MPEKDPTNWPAATWILIFCISFLGGITSWYRRVRDGHTRAFNIIEFFGGVRVPAPVLRTLTRNLGARLPVTMPSKRYGHWKVMRCVNVCLLNQKKRICNPAEGEGR